MSKRKYFGRFTAMSLAGISAVSSMAIVASAEAYPSNVYEFTYKGIASTPLYYSAKSATANNDYVGTALAEAAMTKGFCVSGLDDFKLTTKVVNCANGWTDSEWCYSKLDAFNGDPEAIIPDEYIEDRGAGLTLYFKSKAERDAVVSTVTGKNKSEYSSKYNSALSALSKDLTAANNALYDEDIRIAEENYDTAVKGLDKDSDTYKDDLKDLKDILAEAKDAAKKAKAERTEIQGNAVAEFKEAYAPANWAFGNKEKTDSETAVFVIDDSKTSVVFGGHTGQFISGVDATYKDLNLSDSYYRTVGSYVSPSSYAFAGEIISEGTRQTSDYISAYILDSNRWSQFSAVIEGKPSDNENTTEKDDKEEKKENTWYPDSVSYRVPNYNNISYKGENGYWYTSVAAAELYGNGYANQSKSANYTALKDKEYIYFNASTGLYSTSSSTYSYLVETNEKKKEEETTNNVYADPYYYYYLMSQNGGFNTNTTVDPSAPTIYGSTKQAGWTKILNRVKNTKNGTVTIDMNGASTIPSDVVKAAATNNNTIKAVNENGSIFTVKGSDVSYATSIDTTVKYNVKVVTDTLKAKAIKLNKGAISTTQLVISDDGSIGADATVTVKLSSKRAGCTVKAYRASDDGRKMTLESKGTVQSNGSLNLNVDKGGKFVLVVIE